MVARDDPVECVTSLVGWLGNVLCHVVVGHRAADVFDIIGVAIVVVDIDVTEDEKVTW